MSGEQTESKTLCYLGYTLKVRTWLLFWSKLAEFYTVIFYQISSAHLVWTQRYEHKVSGVSTAASVRVLCLQAAGKACIVSGLRLLGD